MPGPDQDFSMFEPEEQPQQFSAKQVWLQLQTPYVSQQGDVMHTCANGIAVMRNGVLVHVSEYKEPA